MANKKIKAIAKIERDAQNYFFVKMLYGYENEAEPQTIYSIEDRELKENLIALSCMALKTFKIEYRREIGYTIIIYDPETKYCYHGYNTDYQMSAKIIVGTIPNNHFEDINYLIRMISYTIDKYNMGEFWIQYNDRIMNKEEFYEFQKELSIHIV